MKKAVILINMPAPYRVDFFYYMQTHFPDHEIHIFYATRNESNRAWTLDESKLLHSHFLSAFTLRIPRKMDDKYIHIPSDVGRQLSALNPDVVIAQEYNPSSLRALSWARRHHKPFVSWTDGTLHSERNIGKVQRWSRLRIIRRADAFIASSTRSKEAQIAYGANPDRIYVSLLTVDIEKYLVENRREDGHTLLYVGRLTHQKGLDLLFKALALAKKSFLLRIVGDGKDTQAIQSAAEDAGISASVQFVPFLQREALVEEYAKASFFVLPTRDDCYGLVPLEAMCAGLPILCSKYADGAYDQVDEGKTGYIIDPEDTQAFAARLDAMLDNEPLLTAMGKAATEKAHTFAYTQTAPPFIAAIDRALAEYNK